MHQLQHVLVSEEALAKRKAEREIAEAEARAAKEKAEAEAKAAKAAKVLRFSTYLLNLCYDEYGIVFDAHVGQGARWLGCELGLAEDDYFSRYCAS